MSMLTYTEARAFYDRFGARQDAQGYYEDPAVDELLKRSGFEHAERVFELGCGTGRLAQRLLTEVLPPTARYTGVDISSTMVGLARGRLAPFGDRATVTLSEGAPQISLPDDAIDRFLSTYVLDLLSPADIAHVLHAAHRLLRPEGKLCLVSLTYGERGWPRVVSWGWEAIHAVWPARFGGCRPLRLTHHLASDQWHIQHRSLVLAANITSEIVVATLVLHPE